MYRGIGLTWAHDPHLHLRRALTVQSLLGGDGPATDLFTLTATGLKRSNSLDLPPEAEQMRAEIRAEAQRIASAVESALAQAVITASTPDGDVTIRGIGASFGIAQDRKAADEALNQHKRDREAAGTRAGRGEQPPGTTRKPAGGQQDQADRPDRAD